MPILRGIRGTTTISGNSEHTKTNFNFGGYRGISQFISGNKRTGPRLGRPHFETNLFCHASTNFKVENLTEFDL